MPGVRVFTDGKNYYTQRGMGSSGGSGGVNVQTVSYTATGGDFGKLISMNGAVGSPPTGITLTLPATPPSATWWIDVENVNALTLTLNTNGLKLDGVVYPSGSPPTFFNIPQNQGLRIYTDGSNYFTMRGMDTIDYMTSVTNRPSLVNFSAGGQQNGPFTTVTSAAQNITAGNSIVVAMRWGASAVTDTAGNIYIPLPFLQGEGTATDGCQFWYVNNCKGNAANVVTATLTSGSTNTFTYIAVWQIAGGTLIFDTQIGTIQPSANTLMFSNSFNTYMANEIVLVAGQSYTALATYTPGTGWTQDGGSSLAGNQIASAEHKILTSAQAGMYASMVDSGSTAYQIFACCFGIGAVASLSGSFEGEEGYVTNGTKIGETSGSGTGVPVYWSSGNWRIFPKDVPFSS